MIMIKKILFILASLSLLAYVGVAIVSFFDKQGLHKIQLVSYPGDAVVSVNGSVATGQKDYYLEPGVYVAKFEREGFADSYAQINTEIDGDYPILVSMLAESDEAVAWEEENIRERQKFEQLSSGILTERGDDKREKYPIIKHLPKKNNLYSIGYITNDDQTIVVTIHAPDVYVPYALNDIRQWGIDLEDYDIEFVNQRNVFEDEQ